MMHGGQTFLRRAGVRRWASFALLSVCAIAVSGCNENPLTPYDMKRAQEFVLANLPPVPPDPSNAVADDPRAAALGEEIFFDTNFSSNTAIACGSCHIPEKQFQDGLPVGVGLSETPRRTMPLAGAQWGSWFYWDGRKDSQWSQALEPFETPAEHGMTRDMVAREVLNRYRKDYEAVFGPAPDMADWPYFASPLLAGAPQENWLAASEEARRAINTVFSNTGKVLAAYQRTLKPAENRVDRHLQAVLKGGTPDPEDRLNEDEIAGWKLFTGKAQCDACHSGPLYTDQFFHNTGVPFSNPKAPDWGRGLAVTFLRLDEFTCLGEYSDAPSEACRELRFMSDDPTAFEGAFKTPTLRGVASRAPYMHAGQFQTLEEVVDHYVARPDPFTEMLADDPTVEDHGEHTDAPVIELTAEEKRQLVAFLKAL